MLLQVAHLGIQLLEAKQVSGLLPVLRLAGTVSEEPHLQFLKVRSTAEVLPAKPCEPIFDLNTRKCSLPLQCHASRRLVQHTGEGAHVQSHRLLCSRAISLSAEV